MAHPGMKIAVVAGSALALGGAAGTKVSGLVDQWSSGNYAGGGGVAGGAGLLGGGGCGDGEDGDEDGDYGEDYADVEYEVDYAEQVYVDEYGDEYGARVDVAFEDNLIANAPAGYADEQGVGGEMDQGDGSYDPYQTGPCFEDNLLLSAAQP